MVVLFTDNRGEAGQEERAAAAAAGQEAQGEDEDSGAAGGEQAALAADHRRAQHVCGERGNAARGSRNGWKNWIRFS